MEYEPILALFQGFKSFFFKLGSGSGFGSASGWKVGTGSASNKKSESGSASDVMRIHVTAFGKMLKNCGGLVQIYCSLSCSGCVAGSVVYLVDTAGTGIPIFRAVLRIRVRIRIRRIRMFLGLLDPDPDPLVRGMDPDPDPSIIKQINLHSFCFVRYFFLTFIFEKWCKCTF